MAPTDQQKRLEHERDVAQMRADIERGQAQTAGAGQDWRPDPARVTSAASHAGAGLLGFFIGRGH